MAELAKVIPFRKKVEAKKEENTFEYQTVEDLIALEEKRNIIEQQRKDQAKQREEERAREARYLYD